MIGLEYILLHVQGPILYVIRKQHRHSPNDVTPIADYYIIAGTVYQAPDLASVFNSRILSITHHLQGAFEEAINYSRYHPNKGYSWDFSSNKASKFYSKNKKKSLHCSCLFFAQLRKKLKRPQRRRRTKQSPNRVRCFNGNVLTCCSVNYCKNSHFQCRRTCNSSSNSHLNNNNNLPLGNRKMVQLLERRQLLPTSVVVTTQMQPHSHRLQST